MASVNNCFYGIMQLSMTGFLWILIFFNMNYFYNWKLYTEL